MFEEIQSIAWADFMKLALDSASMRAEFESETSIPFRDSARYVVAFVKWATLNHWGLENAPVKYREAIEKQMREAA